MEQRKKLGEILLEKGLITEEQLKEVLLEQQKTGISLGQILIDRGLITPNILGEILSKQLGIEYKKVSEIYISPDSINLIPENIIKDKKVFPIKKENDTLEVAILPPINPVILDDIKELTGLKIKPIIVTDNEFQRLLNQYFNIKTMASKTLQGLRREEKEVDTITVETPIVKFVNTIINDAINQNASDIHFDPNIFGTRVRYRIDGMLQDIMNIQSGIDDQVMSRIKIMAGMDIAEKRRPQDGRFSMKINDKEFDFRVSSIGTRFGEKLEIRILNKTKVLIELSRLGMNEKQQIIFEKIIRNPYGMVLVTGPTGSGKTTTLYATLNKLNSPERSIFTIEDPVEYNLPGVIQMQINPKAGITFSSGLRNILRLDPDIIMVGEIRDLDTAKVSIEAALTGHLVLSTLHTNDAPSTLVRLIDIGIEPYLISSVLVGVVAQRLLRTICPSCKVDYKPTKEELNLVFGEKVLDREIKFKRGKGCGDCNYTGYRGRIGVFEVLPITKNLKNLIISKESNDSIANEARKEGMMTLLEAGFEKVIQGITTVEEVLRVIRVEE
ncbi:MAG: GspE/PulE family protein [Caldisericia bacterium]